MYTVQVHHIKYPEIESYNAQLWPFQQVLQ